MPQILEATMLICFGFSWPMSVYKNIKAKTAKSMSLPFILLIVTGYIAGIAAKLWTHTINYVLVVYVLNLLIVISINLGVMNLLPLPALDGGHILLYLVEAVRRKPLKPEVEGIINFVGLALLLGLAVIITIKDVIAL